MPMKFKNTIEITHIISLLALIISVIVWGIRMEGRIDGFERLEEVRWTENNRRLERLRDDLIYTDRIIREQEKDPCPLQP